MKWNSQSKGIDIENFRDNLIRISAFDGGALLADIVIDYYDTLALYVISLTDTGTSPSAISSIKFEN